MALEPLEKGLIMRPRRRPRFDLSPEEMRAIAGVLMAHPWFCPGCKRTVRERDALRKMDGDTVVFGCPHCHSFMGSRGFF